MFKSLKQQELLVIGWLVVEPRMKHPKKWAVFRCREVPQWIITGMQR